MVLSEWIRNLSDSTAGKVAAASVAVIAVGGLAFMVLTSAECGSNNGGYGPQVSPEVMASDAQKTLDQVKANKTLPAGLKEAEIKHLEGEIAQAQGKNIATTPGPPPAAKP